MKQLDNNLLESMKDFINQYQISNGRSPSLRTIMKELHISGFDKVRRYLQRLEANGLITKTEIGGISIPENLRLDTTTQAPVVGQIACGNPILAIENIEAVVNLPEFLFGKGEFRVYKAKGDSMIGIGIYDGDWIVAKPTSTAEDGDVVVAIVEDSATVKTYHKRKGKIILHPENPDFKDIVVDECLIQGIVKKVIHSI